MMPGNNAMYGVVQPGAQATAPAQPMSSAQPGATNVPSVPAPEAKSATGLIKTVAIVILSLVSVTFIGLFVWMMMQYNDVSADVNGQIQAAVSTAVNDNTMELELEFAEREKDPYRDFAGPADYGGLSFEYPKTWSVYVAADASKGGDYQAYFNPIEVNTVSKDTINALRLTIRDAAFDTVAAEYQRYLERQNSNLSVQAVTVAGTAANRYTGTIPDTSLNGIIVIFKIRDKTAVLQTDSLLFESDFNKLLESVQFNA